MTDVLIRSSITGEEYVISSADFDKKETYFNPQSGEMKSYADSGFKIVHQHPSGEPYKVPAAAKDK